MKDLSKLNRQMAGISLLEVLLSLGIIAIILVMVTQYSLTATSSQKLNIVRTIIGADISAIQSYGFNNVGYQNISISNLVNSGYLSSDPKNITCTGNTCNQYTPWGSPITLSGSTGSATLTIPLPGASALCKNLQESYNNKNTTGTQLVACGSGQATVTISNSTGL
jgi:type II secretory pathway pseudopilin PulG